MSLGALLNQTLIIERAAVTTDRYGNAVRDWSQASRTAVSGRLETEERRAEEDVADRDQLTARGVAFLAPDADILGTDRILDSLGVRYEVIGQPAIQTTPRGPHHIEVRVTSMEG